MFDPLPLNLYYILSANNKIIKKECPEKKVSLNCGSLE